MLKPFIWQDGRAMTPEQVERKRALAAALAARSTDTSPVGHWTQGAARMAQALSGVLHERRAERGEAEGLASADEFVSKSPVLSALLGGDQVSMQTPDPIQIGEIPAAQPAVSDAQGGLPASIIETESGGNWNALNSEGYGGRGQFGADRLADAARAGIIPAGMTGAEYSRQPASVQQAVENWHKADILGSIGQYVGTDVDGSGPIPPLTENSLLAVAHLGGTGGAKRFIESGGRYDPADSNGTNLSDYAIRHAGGSGGAPVPQPSAASFTPQQSGPSPVLAALASAQSNPWVAQKYGPVLQSLMGQEMARGNAAFDQQLQQSDPAYQLGLQKAQLELQQMQQPQAPKPIEVNGQLIDPTTYQVLGDYRTLEGPEQQALMNAGEGQIYNPNTGEWITAPGGGEQQLPEAVQALQWRAEQAGLKPNTPEYAQFMVDGGRSNGMAIDVDPATGAVSVRQGAGAGASGKPFTGEQSKDIGFATRARAALETFDPVAEKLTSRGQQALGAVPWGFGRDYQEGDYQVAENAGTQFLLSILRKDTGAAVTPSEEAMYGRVFLPAPGDSPEVLSQKKQARALAVAGLEAGMPPEAIFAQGQALISAGAAPEASPQPAAPAASQPTPRRRYNPQTGEFE